MVTRTWDHTDLTRPGDQIDPVPKLKTPHLQLGAGSELVAKLHTTPFEEVVSIGTLQFPIQRGAVSIYPALPTRGTLIRDMFSVARGQRDIRWLCAGRKRHPRCWTAAWLLIIPRLLPGFRSLDCYGVSFDRHQRRIWNETRACRAKLEQHSLVDWRTARRVQTQVSRPLPGTSFLPHQQTQPRCAQQTLERAR